LASVLLTDVFDHQELRGDIFVALAGLLADRVQVLLAAGAMLFFHGEIVLDALAFQVRWKRPVTSGTVRELGLEVAVEAAVYTVEGLVAAVLTNRLTSTGS
jgi:hypothetical protein